MNTNPISTNFSKLVFPQRFEEVTEAIQTITHAPAELITGVQLSVMSLAAQGVVVFEHSDGRRSPVSLYSIVLAESGERKTAVCNLLQKPIQDFQKKHLKTYEGKINIYEADLQSWAVINKTITRQIRKNLEKGGDSVSEQEKLRKHYINKPPPPKRPKLLYSDATPEAITQGLVESIGTSGLISDEGGVIFNGRAMGNTPLFNQLWDGGGVDVERKGHRLNIDDARLMTLIVTQKNELILFRKKHGTRVQGNGFFARCLWSGTTSTQGIRTHQSDVQVDTSVLDKFNKRVEELLEQTLAGTTPYVMHFSADAKIRFAQYQNEIERRILAEKGKHDALPGILSKLPENAVRLAALMHFFYEFEGDEINVETLNYVFLIMEYYYQQAVNILTASLSSDEEDAKRLWEWLMTGPFRNNTSVAKSHIRRYAPYQLRDVVRFKRALRYLEDAALVSINKYKNSNGTVSQMVDINR
ncbi:YfjI family protein [Escherichia coli]|uniref:YfjI family protein n=1 Tax=Escherichia coli TaxID=562 RepID=UPI000BEA28AB|nr:YfjI family protein [Escherichia coli]